MLRLIRVALLWADPELGKRVRIAASLQAGNGFDVRLVEASTSAVDLAVIDAERPDADVHASRFQQAGVPLVQLGSPGSARFSDHIIDARQSIADIQRALRELLTLAVGRPERQINANPKPLIVRLCEPDYLDQASLQLCLGELKIVLQRRTSRVLASSSSAIEQAVSCIHEDGWALHVPPSSSDMARVGEVRGSLDGFLIQAALATRGDLPAIESNRFHLRVWPDLTACGEPAVVRLSALLVNGRWSAAELAERCGADEATVNACLWATRAAGLLDSDRTLVPANRASRRRLPSGGLLSRLAHHFGLGQFRA